MTKKQYRKRLDIISDMLNIAKKGGQNKTNIMCYAGLNYQLLKKYLKVIMDAGFVIINPENKFELTPRGKQFLETWMKYAEFREWMNSSRNLMRKEEKKLEKLINPTR